MTLAGQRIFHPTAAAVVVLAVIGGTAGHGIVHGASVKATGGAGGTILFSQNHNWYTIAPNGTNRHMLPLSQSNQDCPDFGCAVFSPQGTRIMVIAQLRDRKRMTTAIVKPDGSDYRALPLPDMTISLAPGAWSPDGARIALTGWDEWKSGRNGIYEVNASDGQGLVRIASRSDHLSLAPLAYSPDGSTLLYFYEAPNHAHDALFETQVDGTGRVKLNPAGTGVNNDFGSPASWSPSGKQVAFTAFTSGGTSAVFVVNADGSQQRRITGWGDWSTSAHWSPDGTWIAFDKVSCCTGNHNIFLVRSNGTGLKEVRTVPGGGVCCVVWSPSGNKLLFHGTSGYLYTSSRDGSALVRLTRWDPSHETAEYAWGR